MLPVSSYVVALQTQMQIKMDDTCLPPLYCTKMKLKYVNYDRCNLVCSNNSVVKSLPYRPDHEEGSAVNQEVSPFFKITCKKKKV